MENMFKRFLSMALAVLMVVSMMPTTAFATETETDETTNPDANVEIIDDGGEEGGEPEAQDETAAFTVGNVMTTEADTLEEAIAAVAYFYETIGNVALLGQPEIKLEADYVLTAPVVIDSEYPIIIDLQGHNLTYTGETAGEAMITNKCELTITNGTVAYTYTGAVDGGKAANTIRNDGKLVLDANVTNTATAAASQIGYAVDCYVGSELTVEGGNISASGSSYYDGIRLFCSETASTSVTVKGGSVSSIWMQNPSDGNGTSDTKDVKGSVAISGGTVNALYLEPSAEFEASITGGTVNKVSYFSTSEGRDVTGFITGGTIGNVEDGMIADGYKLGNDGKVVEDLTVGKVAEVNGVYYDTFDAAYKAAKNGDTIVLLETAVIDGMIANYNTKTVTVKAEGLDTAFLVKDSVMMGTFGGMTVETDGTCITVGESATGRGPTVDINGGTYKGGTSAITVVAGLVRINNGVFSATGDVTIDAAVKNVSANGGKYDFDPTAFVPGTYVAQKGSDGYWTVAKAVAQIGEVKYIDLASAINAAQAGETVTLLRDINLGDITSAIIIPKNITIDGEGYWTITVNSVNDTWNNALFAPRYPAAYTFKNVTIDLKNAAPDMAAFSMNYGGTLENVTVKGAFGKGVSVDRAYALTVTDCTFDGTAVGVNAPNSYAPYSTVTITGTTFNTTGAAAVLKEKAVFTDNIIASGSYVEATGYQDVSKNFWNGNNATGEAPTAEQLKGDEIVCDTYYAANNKGELSDLRDNGEPEEPVIRVVIGGETYEYGLSKLPFLSELFGSNTKEGAKITLLADVTLENGIQVAAYGAFDENDKYVLTPKTVEIDLGGYTLNGFVQFNSGVTGTVKNGTINNSSNYPAIDVSGTATVEGLTVKSTATKAFRVAEDGILTVKEGTYSSDPTAYLPEGYIAVADNGNYTVKQGQWVAEVNGTKYETLAEAVAAAQNGETVTLLSNLAIDSETYTIADGVSITLDMNGKKLTVTDNKTSNYELFYIYGELTVTGNGTIELTATNDRDWNAMSAIFHNRGGVLNIENGTYTHNGGTDMAYVVDNSGNWYGDATTNIKDGTLTSSYIAIRNRMEQNSHGASGTAYLNVSGGNISGTSRAIWAQASSTSATSPATGEINVSGGNIGLIDTPRSAGAVSMTTISGGTVAEFKGEVGELTVKGGTITGTVTIMNAAGEEAAYAVTDAGLYVAAVAQVGTKGYATLAEAVAAAQNGDTITLLADCAETITIEQVKGLSFTIDGNGKTMTGKFTVKGRSNDAAEETLTIKNFKFETSTNSHTFIDATSKKVQNLTVEGCSFTTEASSVVCVKINQAGNITVKDCTTAGVYYLVNNTSGGSNLVIDGCTVNSFYGVRVHNNINAVIKNSTFNTDVHAIVLDAGNSAVTTIENCNITVEREDRYAVFYNAPAGTRTVVLNGTNTFTNTAGTEAWNNAVSAGNYKIVLNDAAMAAPAGMVAKSGNAYYNSLAYAIADAEDNATVTLIQDINIADVAIQSLAGKYNSLFVVAGKTLTIDLNGKTISGTYDVADDAMLVGVFSAENGGHLTLTGNGTVDITATDKVYCMLTAFDSTATLTVESGTYKLDNASNSLVYADGSEIITVNGGNFYLGNVGTGSNGSPWIFNTADNNKNHIHVTGGTFNADVMHQYWEFEVQAPEGTYVACKDNGNGTWTITEAVAYVGEKSTSSEGYTKLVGYATLAEAIAAADAGETVTLLADVELSEMIVNTKKITLDLNGKTITGTDNTTKNFSLIDNRGELTITGNGKMTLTATVNSGWSRYSAVIANNPGGKLIVENGTIEHLGGTDMAYGIDNLTNGKGTYAETVINGGTIKSTYRGIRQFLNGVEAQNILTVNGGTIEGANKSIWMQDPSAKANTGALTVGENATLKGDVYLFVTAGSTEWPVTVSIASAALADGSTVVTGNVPYGYVVEESNGAWGVREANYVAKVGEVGYETIAEAFAAAQAGDEVTILVAGTYALSTSGKNITITGAVDGVVFDNIGAHNMGGASVTFNNVTFDYYPNVNYTGLQHSGNLVYNNCTFNGQVFLYGASETFNNCTFNQNSADAYNVWTYGAKEVAFNECTFNSVGKSVLIYSEDKNLFNDVTVTDCDFIASAPVDGKAAIEMDSSLTAGINLTVDAATTATGFGSGNVSGNSLWNNKKGSNTDANNDITVVVGDETVLAPVTFVAKIGDTGYTTIAAAFAAAQAGDTVTLLADVEASEVILIDKSLTINGNGHKITSSASRVIRVTTSDVELTLNAVNVVSTAVRVGTNDIRGIAIDASLSNVELTLNNCSVDFTDASACDWSYAVNVAGNGTSHIVTINGGSYEGANVINAHGANNTITVKDAALTSLYPNNDMYYGACIWVLQNQGSSVEATGNTFNGANAIVFNLGTGTALTESNNTDNTTRCVAKIGNEYYTSLAAAFAAAQDGDTIKVLHDIELSEIIANTKKVTLDLNGKTITGTDNTTKNFSLIDNRGELTITGDGKMTLTATVNSGWSRYSAVIANNPGGKLVVENGTIEHLGGTDMAYGIDNLTNGKGTYAETVINGGTIKSTYRGIRQFLNGVEAQNILTVNGGTIEGANKSIWMQDPSAKANTGALTVGENATLKGDVYLFVTAGSTEWPVEISIASAALADGSTVVTGNVPATYVVEESNGIWGVSKGLKGKGTETDPYQIGTLSELILFRDSVNAGETKYNAPGVYVALTADIDMAGIDWSVNIGDDCNATFDGIFDGQNHTISNLTSTETAQKADGYVCTGLFGAIYGNAVVKNLTIDGAEINTGDFTGNNVAAVVGFAYSCTGSIENVNVVNSTINATKVTGVGAIVGYDYYSPALTVKGCSVTNTTINGQAYVGGVVGYASNKINISDCEVEETEINGVASVGGVAGIVLGGGKVENATVKSVDVAATGELWANSAAIVAGTMSGNAITVSGTTYEDVNVTAIVGGVLVEKPTAPIAKVAARIGDVYYTTFAAAYAAAKAGDTIELLVPYEIKAGETVTLDLTDKTLVGNILAPNANLTIKGGKIVNTNSAVSALEINAGKLTLTDVVIESARHAVRIDGAVEATINGGEYKLAPVAKGTYHAVNVSGAANVTIKGGTFVGPKGTVADSGAAVNVQAGATVTIEGGNFSGGKNNTLAAKGTLTVTGGTFDQNPAAYVAEGYCVKAASGVYTVAKHELVAGETVAPTFEAEGYTVYTCDHCGVSEHRNVVPALVAVAQIGDTKYETLAEAIADVKNGETITLLVNSDEDVTVVQAPDVAFTIDGNNKTMTGTITVNGKSAAYATAGLTIKNVNFKQDTAEQVFINLGGNNNIRYTSNVTVTGCTFTGTDNTAVGVKNYTGGCKNLTVTDCTATGVHSLVQVKGVGGLTVKNVTVEGKNGISVGTSTNVVIENANITATGYGVRADGGAYNMTVKNSEIDAELPIVVRKVSAVYDLALEGNTLKGTNENGYQVIFTTGDDGTYVAPSVKLNITGAEGMSVFPAHVANIGDTYYTSLQEAVNAVAEGGTIELVADCSDEMVFVKKQLTIKKNGFEADLYAGKDANKKSLVVTENDSHYVVMLASALVEGKGEALAYIDLNDNGTFDADETLQTLQEALDAAAKDQVVRMTADLTVGTIILPSDVTLDIDSYTLTADRIIGLNGSKLMANTMSNSTESGSGFLKVKKDNVLLDDGCVVASNGYGILPVWNPDAGHYEFALMRVYDQYSSNGLSVTEDNIRFVFRHEVGGYYKRFLLNNGGLDNGVKVTVTLAWEGELGTAYQTFVYNENFFQTVNNATNMDYFFNLDEYDLLGIDLNKKVTITAAIETDCGMSHSLEEINVTLD